MLPGLQILRCEVFLVDKSHCFTQETILNVGKVAAPKPEFGQPWALEEEDVPENILKIRTLQFDKNFP